MQYKSILLNLGLSQRDVEFVAYMLENPGKFKPASKIPWYGLKQSYTIWQTDQFGRRYQKFSKAIDVRLDKMQNIRVTPYSECTERGTIKHGFLIEPNGLIKAYIMHIPLDGRALFTSLGIIANI